MGTNQTFVETNFQVQSSQMKFKDVIGLVERHIHSRNISDLVIPGYSRLTYKYREPHKFCICRGKGISSYRGFNAHTRNKTDIIERDKFDQFLEFEYNYSPPATRNSDDRTKTNLRGEELLELCKSHNLTFLSGRKTGNPFGKVTSHQWTGKALVNYAICSTELFKTVTTLK